MEMAAAAFSAIGSAVSTGASAVASAAPSMSTVGNILQGVTTAGSVLSGFMSGNSRVSAGFADVADLRLQSSLLGLQNTQDNLESQSRAIELRRDALKSMGAMQVAFGSVGAGRQTDVIGAAIDDDLKYGLGIENTNRKISTAKNKIARAQLAIRGGSTIAAAEDSSIMDYLGAAIKGGEGLLSIIKRG